MNGRPLRTVCVYTGSYSGAHVGYAEGTRKLVAELAKRKLDLVYGGGRLGLMGALADAALEAGIRVTGVIPQALTHHEVARHDLDDLHVVATMAERQQLMAELSDGFVGLPGGYGTLAEITDVLARTQLGLLRKPVALFDVGGYWEAFERQLDVSVREGFVTAAGRGQLLVASDPRPLLDHLASWQPQTADPRVAVPTHVRARA